MEPPSRDDIEDAAARLHGRIRRTPVLHLEAGAFGLDCSLTLKFEFLQPPGSFKARGALNLLAARDVPPEGVVAASGGNFGLAVAWAAAVLGLRATIFVPESTPAAKLDRLRTFGAQIVVGGAFYADAYETSVVHATTTGALLAHAYDQPEVVAGAGTIARELSEADQAPDGDTVLVAVGGAGLIGGIASWYRGEVKVVAVETESTASLHAALAAGRPVDVAVGGVAADSLGARRVGEIGFAAARRWVTDTVLVSDAAVVNAQRRLWAETRIASEPASAAPLAALLTGAYKPAAGERVVLLVCGANLDPATLS